jgi:hypothetical protein
MGRRPIKQKNQIGRKGQSIKRINKDKQSNKRKPEERSN